MRMDNNEALHIFGKLLIEQARDPAIEQYEKIISGQMRGVYAEKTHHKIRSAFNGQQLEILQELLPDIVDTAIAHIFWMIDQQWIDISFQTDTEMIDSLRHISDGVEGDFYGWISQFSKRL